MLEYGLHEITVGEGGNASGYFEATTVGGDVAYLKWALRAFYVAGSGDKPRIVNSGYWELASGTGQFANMRGVGTMLLEFVSKTERRFVLEGEISTAP